MHKVQPVTVPVTDIDAWKVEKVSQNVDMDTMPVCFGDFKKCTVNCNFK